jgi:Protein of unknown function (DUF4240)
MTIDQFWAIIHEVHNGSNGDMDQKCELLDERLRQLSLDEVRSFGQHFIDCEDRAYTWELWAAAYIICGGCSDDKFSDFRSTLISNGRETFEMALANSEALADIKYNADNAAYEGYQYVPWTVYGDMSSGQRIPRLRPHPTTPSGQVWDEAKVAETYPKLAEQYDYRG